MPARPRTAITLIGSIGLVSGACSQDSSCYNTASCEAPTLEGDGGTSVMQGELEPAQDPDAGGLGQSSEDSESTDTPTASNPPADATAEATDNDPSPTPVPTTPGPVINALPTAPVSLSELGEACELGSECSTGYCVDGVCCNSACDDVCVRCDNPESAGTCDMVATDEQCGELTCAESTDCRQLLPMGGNCSAIGECATVANCEEVLAEAGTPCAGETGECDGQGVCDVPDKASLGAECVENADCAEGNCVATADGSNVCCDAPCDGLCQACGADGRCDEAPETDERCEAIDCPDGDLCSSYPPDLAERSCASFGQCVSAGTYCLVEYAPLGTSCGTGLGCDGAGVCTAVCSPDQILCGESCIDPLTSNEHCGAAEDCSGTSAGVACSDGESCLAGTCVTECTPNEVRCDGSCVDPTRDNLYCGASEDCTGVSAGEACAEGANCLGSTCRSWTLEDASFVNARYVGMSGNDDGDVVVLWVEEFDGADSLWADRFVASTNTWDGPALLEDSEMDVTGVFDEQIAVGPDGSTTAVWRKTDSLAPLGQVRVARMNSSGQWGAPYTLGTDDRSSTTFTVPVVVALADGTAMTTWSQNIDQESTQISWANSGALGWQQGTVSTSEWGYSSLSADGAGGAMVLTRASSGHIVVRRWEGSSWGVGVTISTGDGNDVNSPKLGLDAQGNAFVAWNVGVDGIVQVRRFDVRTSTWQTTRTFNDAGPLRHLHVTPSGTALLSWTGTDGPYWTFWQPTTGAWLSPQLSTVGQEARLASNARGEVIALDYDGINNANGLAWGVTHDLTTKWSPFRHIDAIAPSSSAYSLTLDNEGRALATILYSGDWYVARLE